MPRSKGYFQTGKFGFPADPTDYAPVRECQFGAYWSCIAHFTASHEPALLSIPTGAGKTALMTALSFGLSARRVLVINPSEVLRGQLAEQFQALEHLRNWGSIAETRGGPRVFNNEHRLGTTREWKALEAFDVICATPRTVSPEEQGVCKPAHDLFDLVFIDEAHHEPARTWSELLKLFPDARYVLLTATPFRRDKRRINAKLIYHYPIRKALDAGIYKPVIYHAVEETGTRAARDKALCLATRRLLRRRQTDGSSVKMLIRTDRVEWAGHLAELYNSNGVHVAEVDYTKSFAENQEAINRVRDGELDGMVCVGMLGEGLDIPELKVAVLHSAPRSLPFTVQFIGRVSRSHADGRQLDDAHLFSVPEEVVGEMRKLHHEDADWRDLIPKLAERAVARVSQERKYISVDDNFDIDPRTLKPFFSVRIYDAARFPLDHAASIDLPEETALRFRARVDNTEVLITETEETPMWAHETGIVVGRLDLHVYFRDDRTGLLFESTNADSVAAELRASLVHRYIQRVAAERVHAALHGAENADYMMLGLRNLIPRGPAEPSYKILMGSELQAAVNRADGRSFGPGHALAKISDEETRGVAGAQARVWAVKRDAIGQFELWCTAIADSIRAGRIGTLPHLEWMASPQAATRVGSRPAGVSLDPRLLRFDTTYRAYEPNNPQNTYVSNIVPFMEVTHFSAREGSLTCAFVYSSVHPALQLQYQPSAPQLWVPEGPLRMRVTAHSARGTEFEGDLANYLEEYPPTFVISESEVLMGRDVYRLPGGLTLPSDVLVSQDWKGCAITVEAGNAPRGRLNVHDWLQRRLRQFPHSVVVKDHLTGEMADFVLVEQRSRRITFFHCKGSGEVNPAARVDDAYEVLGQAIRTDRFVLKRDLLNDLLDRVDRRTQTRIVQGQRRVLEGLAERFNATDWTYDVVAVQPGFDANDVTRNGRLNALILATYEWLKARKCTFSVWCT